MEAQSVDLQNDRLTVHAADASATRRLGAVVGNAASELGHGVLVELRGPLGAGKTTFSQGLGTGMGVLDRVTSPTFALVHEHRAVNGSAIFVHVDLYRIGSENEVRELALDESLADGALVAIEWPERAGTVFDGIARDILRIHLCPIEAGGTLEASAAPDGEDGDHPRRLEFYAFGDGARQLLRLVANASGEARTTSGIAGE